MPTQQRGCSRTMSSFKVQFPFERPYPAQIMVASKVLMALKKRENALVESPTGTGKSLALLCSVLAYQQSFEPESDQIMPTNHDTPVIFYMSRTHTQLKQVIAELGRTSYRPKMTILASRDHLCINKRPKVSTDARCTRLRKMQECDFYFRANTMRAELERTDVFDIEDLVTMGNAIEACPYYSARSLLQPPAAAKIIFCPYNYVINQSIRARLDLNLQNSILIFDEAHNLEGIARDAASSTFDLPVLEQALKTLRDVFVDASVLTPLLGLLQYVNTRLASLTILFKNDAFIESGQQMMETLQDFALGADMINQMSCSIEEFSQSYEDSDNDEPVTLSADEKQRKKPSSKVVAAIRLCQSLCSTLQLLHRPSSSQHYRLALTRKSSDANGAGSVWNYQVSFFCLSASVAMEDLSKLSASIIVASGTLSPLPSFAAELGISFNQSVEAPHVIESDQIWVGVVPDPTNKHPTAKYTTVNRLDYQDQLAMTILKLSTRIPAGVLVFFSSYSLLERLISRWQRTKIYSEMNRIKPVIVEDRSDKAHFNASVKKYRLLCNQDNGAIFFCVFRGKLSEGIDFSNHDARAVICVGIPFSSIKAVPVILKQEYNDMMLLLHPDNPIPSGRSWYCQNAYRALNQALGRCIRHLHDYGAIIFLDGRFQSKESPANVSKWVREHIRVHYDFEDTCSNLESFFKRMSEKFPISDDPKWRIVRQRDR